MEEGPQDGAPGESCSSLRSRRACSRPISAETCPADCDRDAMSWDAASGWVSYVNQVEPEVAQALAKALKTIDFGVPPARWANPDDWSRILDEIGPF